MDSGISMHHLFAAISCAITDSEEIILNPDELQINVRTVEFNKLGLIIK
jgi:ribonuclease PH